MEILIYIFLLLCLVLLDLKLSNGDYFNLTLIFLSGYLLSAICCLYNVTIWNVDIGIETILILLVGMCFFVLGCNLGNKVKGLRISYSVGNNIFKVLHRGEVKWKLYLAIIFDIIIIFLLYRDIIRIASANMVSWGNLFYNFRSNLGNDDLNVGYSMIVNLGLRITKPLAYIYSAISLASILDPENLKPTIKKLPYLTPVILYGFQVILQGYRIQLVALIVAIIFDWFFFTQTMHKWKREINFKIAFRFSIFLIFACIGFYYVKFFIGKLQESNGVILYVTNYLGGSLQLFDMYIKEPVNKGHETFAALVDSLKKYGFFEHVNTVVQHEHRSASTGVYIGNVYTGFRNYLNDYGIMGVCFFSMIFGFIFSKWYKDLKRTTAWNTNRIYSFLLYSSLLYTIVFHFFTDFFYSLIGLGWFFNLFVFYLLVVGIFKIKIGGSKWQTR